MDESVVLRVNGQIIAKIKVIRTTRNTTRLGFECPNEVEVIREELLDGWRGRECQDI